MVTFQYFDPNDQAVRMGLMDHLDVLKDMTTSIDEIIEFILTESEGEGGAWGAVAEFYEDLSGVSVEDVTEDQLSVMNLELSLALMALVVEKYKEIEVCYLEK